MTAFYVVTVLAVLAVNAFCKIYASLISQGYYGTYISLSLIFLALADLVSVSVSVNCRWQLAVAKRNFYIE